MILDVGADHGLASIFLAQQGKKVYASEVRKGPYETLVSHLKKYPKLDITPLFMDGLEKMSEDVTSVLILGMGGETIFNILKNSKEKLSQLNSIVIEPQSDFQKPIEFLISNGFKNDAGRYAFEKHYYPILRFVKGEQENVSEDELKYGIIPYHNKDKKLLEYFRSRLKELEAFPPEIRVSKEEEITSLRRLVDDFETAD